MPRQRDLNARQKKFCQLFTQGETAGNIAQSHRKAGYVCTSIEGHGGNGIRLLRSERIQKEIARLRDNQFKKECLTFNQKRAFLSRVVQSDPRNPDPDLVQEVREEVDKEGNVKRVVKLVSKMDALKEDNIMAGDRYQDREPQQSNGFLFLVNLSQLGKAGAGESVALPSPVSPIAPVIETQAEVITED